jgi:YebC/PmpR family DNA-binding regulatory protein
MSGHSKWAGIKHRKAAQDAKKGRLFSKLISEIITAAAAGGGNIETNFQLKVAVERARSFNLPADNIKKAIQRGTGELPGQKLEEVIYEGYGPGGVALLVEALTDNRNRTTAVIRNLFIKGGGNLGSTGCVTWLFNKKGLITIKKEVIDEDKLLNIALECGVEDVRSDEGDTYELITSVNDFLNVKEELEKRGIKIDVATLSPLPSSYVPVDGKVAHQVLKLIELLEEEDEVKGVYTNCDIPDEVYKEVYKEVA